MTNSELLYNIYKKVLLANKMNISQFIEDYNVKIKEDPNEVIRNLSLLNKEDQLTPVQVVDKMVGKLGDISNPDFIFLDPNCKRGSFLVILHEKYGIPKERLFGVDREPNNVKLLHRLGYDNVIVGNILEENTILELEELKESMGFKDKKFDIVVSNPPYDRNLHLKIIEKALTLLNEDGKGCFIHPARWIEDVLAVTDKKQKSDYKKFYNSIVNNIQTIDLLNNINSIKYFNIGILSDLMITLINMCSSKNKDKIENHFDRHVFSVLHKINSKLKCSVHEKIDFNELKGIRVEIKEILPICCSNVANRKPLDKLCFVCKEYYTDGYNIEGKFWTRSKAKNQFTKEIGAPFSLSVHFDTINKAKNFIESNRNSRFINNLQYMVQTDQHVPLKFLPYIIDEKHGEYEHPWTDEDYCEYFGLNEEETRFMCREVDDYRIKDFINYTEI